MGRLLYATSVIIGAELAFLIILTARYNDYPLSPEMTIAVSVSVILFTAFFFYAIEKLRFAVLKLNIDSIRGARNCEKCIEKTSDTILKSKLAIIHAKHLINKNEFEGARVAIKKANPKSSRNSFNLMFALPDKYKLEYYLTCAYINIVLNNLIKASDELEKGKYYIEKYKGSMRYRSTIFKTAGILEYSKGNYSDAETFLKVASECANSKAEQAEVDFVLAKIYQKTQRYPMYEKLMKDVIRNTNSEYLQRAAKEFMINNKT